MNKNRPKIVILLSFIFIAIACACKNSNESLLPALTPVPETTVGVDRNVVSLEGQWIFNQSPKKTGLT